MSEYIIKTADWAIDYKGESLFKGCEEIVRCKECKHFDLYTGSCARRDYVAPMAVEADDFCSRGERE